MGIKVAGAVLVEQFISMTGISGGPLSLPLGRTVWTTKPAMKPEARSARIRITRIRMNWREKPRYRRVSLSNAGASGACVDGQFQTDAPDLRVGVLAMFPGQSGLSIESWSPYDAAK